MRNLGGPPPRASRVIVRPATMRNPLRRRRPAPPPQATPPPLPDRPPPTPAPILYSPTPSPPPPPPCRPPSPSRTPSISPAPPSAPPALRRLHQSYLRALQRAQQHLHTIVHALQAQPTNEAVVHAACAAIQLTGREAAGREVMVRMGMVDSLVLCAAASARAAARNEGAPARIVAHCIGALVGLMGDSRAHADAVRAAGGARVFAHGVAMSAGGDVELCRAALRGLEMIGGGVRSAERAVREWGADVLREGVRVARAAMARAREAAAEGGDADVVACAARVVQRWAGLRVSCVDTRCELLGAFCDAVECGGEVAADALFERVRDVATAPGGAGGGRDDLLKRGLRAIVSMGWRDGDAFQMAAVRGGGLHVVLLVLEISMRLDVVELCCAVLRGLFTCPAAQWGSQRAAALAAVLMAIERANASAARVVPHAL